MLGIAISKNIGLWAALEGFFKSLAMRWSSSSSMLGWPDRSIYRPSKRKIYILRCYRGLEERSGRHAPVLD
jgi:hypothetical protein